MNHLVYKTVTHVLDIQLQDKEQASGVYCQILGIYNMA